LISCFPLGLIVFLLFGYTAAFLQMTLSAASGGKAGHAAWPGRDLARTVRSGGQAAVSFLVGPVAPVAVGVYFWLNSADLKFVDWLILGELGFVAAGWWLLTLMAVAENDRFRDVTPAAILAVVQRFGRRRALTVA